MQWFVPQRFPLTVTSSRRLFTCFPFHRMLRALRFPNARDDAPMAFRIRKNEDPTPAGVFEILGKHTIAGMQ